MGQNQQQRQGTWCSSCGHPFTTPPRDDRFKSYCPMCAHEYEAFDLLVDDLRRVFEVWSREANLTPSMSYEVLEALYTFRKDAREG
jgi:hypothetical protein